MQAVSSLFLHFTFQQKQVQKWKNFVISLSILERSLFSLMMVDLNRKWNVIWQKFIFSYGPASVETWSAKNIHKFRDETACIHKVKVLLGYIPNYIIYKFISDKWNLISDSCNWISDCCNWISVKWNWISESLSTNNFSKTKLNVSFLNIL